jgi:GNAT superfamily N-acetyltransferase
MASPTYLALAADGGVLRHLDGLPYAAGHYTDPGSGEHQFVIEYCDPRILRDPAALDALTAEAMREDDATHLVLRIGREAVNLPPPWSIYQTYLRYAGPPVTAPDPAVVRPARADETPLIAQWLTTATTTAAVDQDMLSERFDAAASIDDWVNAPDRRSFVYLAGGRPVGHITMLVDAYDDVHDEEFVDLVDVMADPAYESHAVTHALTTAAIDCAAHLGRPLIGNVVHPADPDNGHGNRIVERLIATGWTVAYRFLKRPLR